LQRIYKKNINNNKSKNSIMKKMICMLVASTALLVSTNAQTLKTPQPSTTQKVTQDFGIGTIDLSYSRPNVKGRKIFGGLESFGKVWRTGANTPTRLKFSHDVVFAGTPVKAGEYSLFTIPGETNWNVILNTDAKKAGAADYNKSDDIVNATIVREDLFKVTAMPVVKLKKGEAPRTMATAQSLETFTIQFANITNTTCELHIMWENTLIKVPITTSYDADVMKQIDNLVIKDTKPYYNAAVYYLDNGKDLDQALTWFNKAAEANPKAYWVMYQKAKCLQKLGRKDEAMAASKTSLTLATEAKNDSYVKQNETLQAELAK
jgi:hypothetical protein